MDRVDTATRVGSVVYPIQGQCDAHFTPVLDAFIDNYARGEEVGSSACVLIDGCIVVDLWGGFRDADCSDLWSQDTIVNMMSVAKGATATCVHMLIDRGRLDLDAPVARYWPEFAQGGKEHLPVRYLLDHRAGLPLIFVIWIVFSLFAPWYYGLN